MAHQNNLIRKIIAKCNLNDIIKSQCAMFAEQRCGAGKMKIEIK
jgi:hypothetical protein